MFLLPVRPAPRSSVPCTPGSPAGLGGPAQSSGPRLLPSSGGWHLPASGSLLGAVQRAWGAHMCGDEPIWALGCPGHPAGCGHVLPSGVCDRWGGAQSPRATQALTAACFPSGHQRDGADRAAGLAECDALRDRHLQVLRDLSARRPSRGPASFLCPSCLPCGDLACGPTRLPTQVGAVAGGSSSASQGTGLPAPTAPGSTSAAHPRTRSLPGPACLLPPGSRAQTCPLPSSPRGQETRCWLQGPDRGVLHKRFLGWKVCFLRAVLGEGRAPALSAPLLNRVSKHSDETRPDARWASRTSIARNGRRS